MTASVTIIKNGKAWVDWMDMSGQENEIGLGYQCEEKGSDAYNVGAHVFAPGMEKFSISHKGYLTFGIDSLEEKLVALKGLSNVPMTLSIPGTAGSPCYFMQAAQLSVNRPMPMGEIAAFDMSMSPSALTVIRGTLLEDGSAAKSVTGVGTARQLRAALATEKMYGILHVLAVTGTPTITVLIESDNAVGFPHGVTKLTFAAKTARGSQFITPLAGANTDDWYRASWTISGGTATIVVAVGIL